MAKKTEDAKKKAPLLDRIDHTYKDFMRIAEIASNRHAALKARSFSVNLRKLLKEYRDDSLQQDKKINEIMKKAKQEEQKIRTGENDDQG